MDSVALAKCHSRLRVAKAALASLPFDGPLSAFDDQWYIFLTATKNIYTALEQWSKETPQTRQWFGGIKQKRKDDPVADYMFHARNDDEHGVGRVTEVAGIVTVGFPGSEKGDVINCTLVENEGVWNLEMKRKDGGPVQLAGARPFHFSLRPVKCRGNFEAMPPTDKNAPFYPMLPHEAAIAYLTILEDLIAEASSLA